MFTGVHHLSAQLFTPTFHLSVNLGDPLLNQAAVSPKLVITGTPVVVKRRCLPSPGKQKAPTPDNKLTVMPCAGKYKEEELQLPPPFALCV
ncbi:Hypothetical predicted protein [Podarcis lilfordi]|uniref:Uncharacterized protein n=1 Tax=Podarcis lilfordi TaxID=74358 RepID=A0AA35KS99_9SAUR|nr:Hypothetical predicted protein [Podarcis lilfordi]